MRRIVLSRIFIVLLDFSAPVGRWDCHGLTLAGVCLFRLTHYKSVDETNILIRPRKRKEMGLTYIVICIDLLRFCLTVILFWLNRHAQHIGNAQQNLYG